MAELLILPLEGIANIKTAITQGQWDGKIRAYNNYLDFQSPTKLDQYGTAFGTHLSFATNPKELSGYSLGATYYGSSNLETNKDNPAERAPFTPTVEVSLLGEAYFMYQKEQIHLKFGRQKINTPFANPADAFVVPIAFSGLTFSYNSPDNLRFFAHYLTEIKNRPAQDFENIGHFIGNRYGTIKKDSAHTKIAGIEHKSEKHLLQGWFYDFEDYFNIFFGKWDFQFSQLNHFSPYIGVQTGLQKESGSHYLGALDSRLLSAKIGTHIKKANLSLAIDSIDKDTFRSPFAYFTDTLYTNSMITGMANVAPGRGIKLLLTYDISDHLWAKFSHARFEFDTGAEMLGTDFDIKYKFQGKLKGLQVWERLSFRRGQNLPAPLSELTELRTQLEYSF